MRYSKQMKRREIIEKAALDLLIEKGFHRASLLRIAKRAQCSNETMYRWYGSKPELFSDLVKRYRAETKKTLARIAHSESDGSVALTAMGAVLLERLISQGGIALHRAQIVEHDGHGLEGEEERCPQPIVDESIKVLFDEPVQIVLGKSRSESQTREAVDTFLLLLMGDLPVRRAIGEHIVLTKDQCTRRAQRAMESTRRLCSKAYK